jgi:N-formylglutamate amidohydrolase
VLLLDCHSMPPRGLRHASVVFGDRYGKSASSWIGELARNTMQEDGLSVAFNDPYAGGWIVEGHGRPADGVHAIQIELDRSLYLDATLRRPGARFDEVSRALSRLVQTLGEALLDRQSLPEAAE